MPVPKFFLLPVYAAGATVVAHYAGLLHIINIYTYIYR